MLDSLDLPNGGNGSALAYHSTTITANNNDKHPPPAPPILHPSPTHQPSSRCHRCKAKGLIIISSLLITVIILQTAIIGLILNSHYVQNTDSRSSPIGRTETGKTLGELELRGQMLQLAGLLSWDAKCNRVLHDLVVSCYGAPEYLADGGKDSSKIGGPGRVHFNRSFPRNLGTPPRQGQKFRKLRPMKSASFDEKKNQSLREKGRWLTVSEPRVSPQPITEET